MSNSVKSENVAHAVAVTQAITAALKAAANGGTVSNARIDTAVSVYNAQMLARAIRKGAAVVGDSY